MISRLAAEFAHQRNDNIQKADSETNSGRIHAACSRDAFYCEHEQSVTDTAHALPLKATGIIKILVKGFGHLLAWPLCGTAAASDHRGAVLPAGYKATQAYRDDGSF